MAIDIVPRKTIKLNHQVIQGKLQNISPKIRGQIIACNIVLF